ncbi:hypothetical protein SAMN05216266_10789 [Amycolatopsis marina]|uniref:Uncharacterized protein n=1 Tax=Amycolatopsis marina TaxID=490629 RepID=A0A1I0ZKZ6_9PSEU|nr:hypothetical protein [Amycolatopsis marina]SFB26334.1 hypothetical protein SAMN05216266_10789 [Amycolatopsis marina]
MPADEGHQGERGPDEDPTADFLASVRPEDTPWRVDRPVGGQDDDEQIVAADPNPEKWQRARAVARSAGQAAPYVQGAAFGALAAGALAEARADDSGQESDGGFDVGGMDAGGG